MIWSYSMQWNVKDQNLGNEKKWGKSNDEEVNRMERRIQTVRYDETWYRKDKKIVKKYTNKPKVYETPE